MNKQEILLKDIVRDKTIQELIDLLPLKVCIKSAHIAMMSDGGGGAPKA